MNESKQAQLRLGDWALFVLAELVGVVEASTRETISWASPWTWLALGLLATLLFRRIRPLCAVTVAFGASGAVALAELLGADARLELHSLAFTLALPYALYRWATPSQVSVGTAVVVVSAALGMGADGAPLPDVLGALAILVAAMAVGAALRYRDRARERALEQARFEEREQLGEELNDSLAHHLTAIAVHAQANLAIAERQPEAAMDALRLIEREASASLKQMRLVLRLLRLGVPVANTEARRAAARARVAELQSQVGLR